MKTKLLTSASAILAGTLAPNAIAQNDEAAPEAEARQETVIITATRRAESVQDVPINIAAVGYQADTWSATAYVDNLFDELAETSVAANRLFNQTILGANVRSFRANVLPPRTVGVRFNYRFE